MTARAPGEDAAAALAAIPRSRILRNTGAQMGGRVAIALLRLVVAAIVVRLFGAGTFGEYALVFALLAFAEWIVDFGTTEMFVREASREPARERELLRVVTALKCVQAPVALVALAVAVLVLGYPSQVVEATLVGGAGLVFYAGILVFRVAFKAHLTLEREVAAEAVSVIAMIAMVLATARMGGGLAALVGCHVVSRAIFLALCMLFGRRDFTLSVKGVTRADMKWGAGISSTVGVIGLLVALYEMVDLLVLSKLASTAELGYYSGAQRLLWPLLLALASIGGTLYPIAARYWPADRARFATACQRGLDAVVVLAGLPLASMLAAPEFYLGLLGPDLVAGAPALRLLSLLVFIKAISSTVGPVLFVVHAQRQTLFFIAVAVAMKALVVAVLVARFGYLGAAVGALLVEAAFGAGPTLYLLRRHGELRLRWGVTLKVALAIGVAAAAAAALLPGSSLAAAALAPAVFVAGAAALGALRMADIRLLLRRGES
ncbi:MAG: oligosaccharide flippase family protein [Usitatibacter sp.]